MPGKNTLSYLMYGQKVNYKGIVQASKKQAPELSYPLNRYTTRKYIEEGDKERIIYNPDSGEAAIYKISEKPLILRQFTGYQNVPKAIKNWGAAGGGQVDIINGNNLIVGDKDSFEFKDDYKLNLKYSCEIMISPSDAIFNRKANGSFNSDIGHNSYKYENSYLLKVNNNNNLNERLDAASYYSDIIPDNNRPEDSFYPIINDSIKITLRNGIIRNILKKVLFDYSFSPYIVIYNIIVKNNQGRVFDLRTMKMKKVKYDNIKLNLFREVIDIDCNDENCVVQYLCNIYERKVNDRIKGINVKKYFSDIDSNYKENGIDTDQIIEFCRKYDIKCVAYDSDKNVTANYNPKELRKKRYKSLIYIVYNNHMYPVKNKFLHKTRVNTQTEKILSYSNIDKEFKMLLDNRIIPSDIRINCIGKNSQHITSYVNDNIRYFENEDYLVCKDILQLFGIVDKIKFTTNRYNLMSIIEELYNIPFIHSFFPQLKNFGHAPFIYHTDKEYTTDNLVTIDKQKCYPYCLSQLPFLLLFDIRNGEIIDIEKATEITRSYTYYVKPKYSTELIPTSGLYDGDHLIFCHDEGIEFTILKEIRSKRHDNCLKDLINDWFLKTETIKSDENSNVLKMILNIWIGKFDLGCDTVKSHINAGKICNSNEKDCTSGSFIDLTDDYSMKFEMIDNYKIYTRKLISIQIKNWSRRILYLKMKELKLKDDDIIHINTDSITFKMRKGIKFINFKPNNYMHWRKDTDHTNFKPINSGFQYTDKIEDLNFDKMETRNILYQGYAGCGKSEKIKNEIIPDLVNKNKSYIVLSPSHSSIMEYRLNNDNCNVIQYYEYNKSVPDEDIVIIDEIGLCDSKANDIIYKCFLANKRIYSFGDYNQNLPVGMNNPFNNLSFINYMYNKNYMITSNYRNHFTIKFYDDIINERVKPIDVIKKYMIDDIYKAAVIICPTHKDCNEYNEIIMKNRKIDFGDIGCEIMCITNELRDIKLYNNFLLKIVSKKDDKYILKDKVSEYEVTERQLKNKLYFTPSYARTNYNIQGKSVDSYYVPKKFLVRFNTGREAYTIISRLKKEKGRSLFKNKTIKKKVIEGDKLNGKDFDTSLSIY